MSSVQALMSVPTSDRDLTWLMESLQCAIVLEHSTLPPYLCAMWSIRDQTHEAYGMLGGIVLQEMLHMGLACNLLASIGGSPRINSPDVIPRYPGPLPCGLKPLLNPNLQVGLTRLTPAAVSDVFMLIEYPEGGPIALQAHTGRTFPTIGEFYGAIRDQFVALQPVDPSTEARQIEHDMGQSQLTKILDNDAALAAIELIVEQGEGTSQSAGVGPSGADLAHYYEFKQLHVGRMYRQDASGRWTLSGPFLDFPSVFPMADVPPEGYSGPDVPVEVGEFNDHYGVLVDALQRAWDQGGEAGQDALEEAIGSMILLTSLARTLMGERPLPDGSGFTYGPTFRPPQAGGDHA